MTIVLCFGDSNTHGSVPMLHRDDMRRFEPEERWPGVLRKELGAGFSVIEEGLPGRTTLHDDPIEGVYKNGLRYLCACLESHRPIDIITLMLGTNDLKSRFAVQPLDIAESIGVLLDTIVVRSLLVPALVHDIGRPIWWPSRLSRKPAIDGKHRKEGGE